jgi:hypothetical protein
MMDQASRELLIQEVVQRLSALEPSELPYVLVQIHERAIQQAVRLYPRLALGVAFDRAHD